MKNQTNKIIYFICLTILSSYTNTVCLENSEDIQLSSQFIKKQYPATDFIENLFRSNLQDLAPNALYTKTAQRLIISIESSLFFEKNSAHLNENSKKILDKIGYLIKNLDIPCTIECNTDFDNKENSPYSFSWEISTIRAGKITEYLITTYKIPPYRIRSIGYGDTATDKNLKQQDNTPNSRIDFVITNYDKIRQ